MEDRKRPIPHDGSDDAHPPKRQAVQSTSAQPGHHVPQSQEDVVVCFPRIPYPRRAWHGGRDRQLMHETQHFQKEAIWRQMQEYKRERNVLESRLEELDKRSAYHDDHLRIVDAWWSQVNCSQRMHRTATNWPVDSSLTKLDSSPESQTAERARTRMEVRVAHAKPLALWN